MAAIAHASAEQTTAQTHTGDTNWTDISGASIAAGSFVAEATYLLLASCQYGGNNSSGHFGIRFVHGATPTAFAGAASRIEPASPTATERHTYFYMTKFTQPATAELVKLQFATLLDTSHTVVADTITIIAIRLDADLTDGVDFKYAEDDDTGASTAHTTSFAEFANIVWTPGNADDDWLIFGSVSWEVNDVLTNTLTHFRRGTNPASPDDDAPEFSQEGEDNAGVRVTGMHRVFTLPASSQEFAVDMRDDSATDVDNHLRSAVFALRLNAFEDHGFQWSEGQVDPGTGGSEIAAIDITPTQAGDFLLLGFAVQDAAGSGDSMAIRMTVDTTETPTGVYSHTSARAYDATDENPMSIMAMRSFAASARDLDFDAKEFTIGAVVEDRSFVALSMEVVASSATIAAAASAAPAAAEHPPDHTAAAIAHRPP